MTTINPKKPKRSPPENRKYQGHSTGTISGNFTKSCLAQPHLVFV